MRIKVVKGDITKVNVDVIVNAANSSLLGGGGVDGAIHRAGGPEILNECKAIRNRQGKCLTGDAVYTTAGNLSAQFVIHTVGPVWNEGKGEDKKKKQLESCYVKSLQLMVELGRKTIAFPNISTGIYRFPKLLAAEIAIDAVRAFQADNTINEVLFVCFDDENYQLYKEILNEKST